MQVGAMRVGDPQLWDYFNGVRLLSQWLDGLGKFLLSCVFETTARSANSIFSFVKKGLKTEGVWACYEEEKTEFKKVREWLLILTPY